MLLLAIKEVVGGHLLNHGSLFRVILTDVIIMEVDTGSAVSIKRGRNYLQAEPK